MHDEGEATVCRLCLKSVECTILEDVEAVIEMLGIFGLKLDLNIAEKPVICKTCSENFQQCFDFKTMCLYTEDCIKSFRNDGNNGKLDLREIYLKRNGNENISKCHVICRLCMEIKESGHYMSLNGEKEDVTLVKKMLGRCFSELDLDIIKNPVICASCNGSLQSYFSFIKNYLVVEDELNNYFEIEGSSNKSQVESVNKLYFGAENISNYKNDYTDIDMLKNCIEDQLCDEIKQKFENRMQKEYQELNIKREVNEHEEVDDTEIEKLSTIVNERHGHAEYCETKLKCENFVETETDGFNIKHEEIYIKLEHRDDSIRFQDNIPIPKDASVVPIHQREICNFETENKHNLGIHSIFLEDVSEIVLNQFKECGYQTNSKYLDEHMPVHGNKSEVRMHQCEICTYKTKEKSKLKRHLLIHTNPSEIKMYSCEICTYKAREKHNLKRHMLIHKNTSEVTIYSCEICAYETKRKPSLEKHIMLIHKNHPDVTMYSCEVCAYKATQKDKLKRHVLIHKDPSEITMYPCEECTYKAREKGCLKQHMLIHKTFSEVTTYSCEICTFKTKRKGYLKQHMLMHKNASEVTMYQCDKCTYKTRYKSVIKQHMLIHKNSSEVTMYSCEICTYKTKRKGYLKHHMLIHKNVSEIKMYYCKLCTYKAKHKSNLIQHMLIHKDDSEVIMYTCETCTYKTREKRKLTRHMLIHKNVSEITGYPCGVCPYKTIRKADLLKHILIHRNASEVGTYQCDMCTFKTKHKYSLKRHTTVCKSACEKKM